MKSFIENYKVERKDRVNKTNEFIKLLEDPEKNKEHPDQLSAKEKSDSYGIEVMPVKELFTAYYMKDTKLIGGNKKEVYSNDRTFPVLKKVDMSNWL